MPHIRVLETPRHVADVGGDDAGDYNVTTGNAVTVTIGTLAPAAAATVTFQVTID